MPQLIPSDWPEDEQVEFEVPELPTDSPFLLHREPADPNEPRTSTHTPAQTHGPFSPEEWVTDPDTSITYAHDPDTHEHIILRCTMQWRDITNRNALMLECLDDNAVEQTYWVQELDDNTLEIQEPNF